MQAKLLFGGWGSVVASIMLAILKYFFARTNEPTLTPLTWTAIVIMVVGLVLLFTFWYRDYNSERRRYQMARKVNRGGSHWMSGSWLDRFHKSKSMI